jgi:cell division protein FtsB
MKIKIPTWIRQRTRTQWTYGTIALGFLIWMFFLDTHSLLIHKELNEEIGGLEAQKKALQEAIDKDQNALTQLEHIDSLERFARENYGHKKENETIYIIEYQDSISSN